MADQTRARALGLQTTGEFSERARVQSLGLQVTGTLAEKLVIYHLDYRLGVTVDTTNPTQKNFRADLAGRVAAHGSLGPPNIGACYTRTWSLAALASTTLVLHNDTLTDVYEIPQRFADVVAIALVVQTVTDDSISWGVGTDGWAGAVASTGASVCYGALDAATPGLDVLVVPAGEPVPSVAGAGGRHTVTITNLSSSDAISGYVEVLGAGKTS